MLNGAFLDALGDAPAYCFTTDLDWAPESVIEDFMALFGENDCPVTPFVTHRSAAIERMYQGESARDVGVHPNFRPGSTHGHTEAEVIAHVRSLWPAARCFRSHSFVDSSHIANAFVREGFQYDSNLCLALQPRLVPLEHGSGLIRFPVFMEDDYIAMRRCGWTLAPLLSRLRSPGLKIFNFHPQHVAVNTPDLEYYGRIKQQVHADDWRGRVWPGEGTRTLLVQVLEHVRRDPGLGIFTLRALFERSVS